METCSFRWLTTGDEAFTAMQAAIASAQQSVRLETYTFTPCPVGERFREVLTAAARRGIDVRVSVDAFGSRTLADAFWRPLREAGGQVRWFNPLHLARFTFRDHRKLLVCDDTTALVGGFNVAEEYVGDGVTAGWRDVGLWVEGELARQLAGSFDAMFERAGMEHGRFTRLRRAVSRARIPCAEGDLLLSGPGRGRNAIQAALLADLAQAREVLIVAAYFLPTGRLRRALLRRSRRGTRVRLILPGHSDVPLSRTAGHAHYQRFLRAGFEIHEYQPQILHSKLVIIDDAVYVGSSNLDARSLFINYELMLRLTKPELVAAARGLWQAHRSHSRPIHPRTWRRSRSCWQRLQERWASLLLGRLDPWVMRRQLRAWRS